MSTETDRLRSGIADHLDATSAPPGDLAAVRRRGRTLRRRRAALVAAAAVAVVVGGSATVTQLSQGRSDDPTGPPFAGTGTADTSHGLRAYAAPAAELHLAGRTFPAAAADYLDTDAVATPFGVVLYDKGLPELFAPDGSLTRLAEGPVSPSRDFHPTAKADSTAPLVAFAVLRDGQVTITLFDLEANTAVAERQVPCAGGCRGLVIDAVDDGAVFVRDQQGTFVWDTGDDSWTAFSGPKTRVADVRAGVVLYDGPRPNGPATKGFRLVPGAIDSLLTFDGEHELGWSSTLEPTRPGGRPLVLERGPKEGDGLAWWTVDTDGSVLVAVGVVDNGISRGNSTVYDCALPSGRCTELGPLLTEHGDPLFIGSDM